MTITSLILSGSTEPRFRRSVPRARLERPKRLLLPPLTFGSALSLSPQLCPQLCPQLEPALQLPLYTTVTTEATLKFRTLCGYLPQRKCNS